MPANVVAEEILTDHPARYRAMLVESGNPAHSLADSQRMREALSSLEHLVVIDVAMTETARLAHYVLPVPSQYEKWEATFFNFDFPRNVFHLRRPLLEPLPGTLAEPEIHARLCEALGAFGEEDVAPAAGGRRGEPGRLRRRLLRRAGGQARARSVRAEPAVPHARPHPARRRRGGRGPLGRRPPLRAGEPGVGGGGRVHGRGPRAG